MKEDSQKNKIWREDRGNIKAKIWWRRIVKGTSGERYGGKNLYLFNETNVNKHNFNYEGRQLGERNLERRGRKH